MKPPRTEDAEEVSDDVCTICGANLAGGGSHYHCGQCGDERPTSMFGHYVQYLDGGWGFTCDPKNAGRPRHQIGKEH